MAAASISGLGLVTTTVNAQETDSLEGIPSELLGGVDVYKSPNASQLEGGLGGIVNLKTRNPFSLGEGTNLAGNVRYADAGEGWEPLGALVASHKFNDRLAVIASVSYDKQVFQTDVLGGQNRGGWKFTDRPDRLAVPQNYIAPEYRYATDRDEERERLGASLSVAFRPTDSLEVEGMWFHSQRIKRAAAPITTCVTRSTRCARPAPADNGWSSRRGALPPTSCLVDTAQGCAVFFRVGFVGHASS